MHHLNYLADKLIALQSGLGARIRAHRKQAGLSQQELAERAGLHRGTIADLERARRDNVCLSTAWRITLALGLKDVSLLTASAATQPSEMSRDVTCSLDAELANGGMR